MPRFYFDTHDGAHRVRDERGLDLPDPDLARRHALRALPDLARECWPLDSEPRDVPPARGRLARKIGVDVRDGGGRVLFTAALSLMTRNRS